MNIVLDVILLFVIVFCTVYYYRQGFATSVVGFARFILAAAFSFAFSGLVSKLLYPAIARSVGEDDPSDIISASQIAYALAFVIVFILAMLLMGFMKRFLHEIISRIPILGTIDGLFGGGIGLLVGALFAALIVELYAVLAVCVDGGIFSMTVLNDSVIAEFLYENNLFGLIFKSFA